MRFIVWFFSVLAASACVVFLAACSGAETASASSAISPAAGQPESARGLQGSISAEHSVLGLAGANAASTGSVIISALGEGEVDIYTDTLKLASKITGIGFPTGLALDAAGNLYVANEGKSSPGILVYKNDYKTLVATLSDPSPSVGVAVDAATGVVAATNGGSNIGSVTFYAKGATTPCATVSSTELPGIFQGAFDNAGNFYETGGTPNRVQVVGVISGGCAAKTITLLSTANTFSSFIFGIQVTRFGKIAVEDQGNRTIYTYNPPVKGALGVPIATTPLGGAADPSQFAFTEEGAFIFVADQGRSRTYKYAYPAGGSALQTFATKTSEPMGLVVTSPAQP